MRFLLVYSQSVMSPRPRIGQFLHTPSQITDAWKSILRRCLDSQDPAYNYYGGRGITVCLGLQASSDSLFEILGFKPTKGHSIDRPNNQGGYWCGKCQECLANNWPKNVRWATKSEQQTNRRGWSWDKKKLKTMATESIRGGTLTTIADGEKLKSLRGDRKQRDVEKATGISPGQLTRFETGKPVGIKYILKLASFYRTPPKDLLDAKGIATTSELLRDLAELHGARLDFSHNGESGHSDELGDSKYRLSGDVNQTS